MGTLTQQQLRGLTKMDNRAKAAAVVLLLLGGAWAYACEEVRSQTQRARFVKANPCPATGKIKGACPGHVVDHIVPIACGGPDTPGNMQWQTTVEGKIKDRWEIRAYCGKGGT